MDGADFMIKFYANSIPLHRLKFAVNGYIKNRDYLRTIKNNTIIGWVLVALDAKVRQI
jgi:hypothetical protein